MSLPKEPRQLMINMMYLVLTVLLALNISAEILNAFRVVNDGIDQTKAATEHKNGVTYELLSNLRKTATPEEVVYISRAEQAKRISADLDQKIEAIKKEIIDKSGGITSAGIIKKEENQNIPAEVMLTQKKGYDLQQIINQGRTDFLGLVDETDREKIAVPLSAENPANDTENRDWVTKTFEGVPSVAAVTILNQLQSDIKTSEANVINYLLDQVRLEGLKFNNILAQVFSENNYVLSGEPYVARIFPAAFDSTQNPEVYFGKLDQSKLVEKDGGFEATTEFPLIEVYDSMQAENGMATYRAITSGAGEKNYEGAIAVKNQRGTIKYYPFKQNYQVVTSTAVVSPEKMNVLYVGVDNPLSISVPGFTNSQVSADITQGSLSLIGSGEYVAHVSTPGKCDVAVYATMSDGKKRQMGRMEFRVKSVPLPVCKVMNFQGGGIKKSVLAAGDRVDAILDNFDFNYHYTVTEYHVVALTKNESILDENVAGNAISQAAKKFISEKMKPGDKIYFEYVKAKGSDGRVVPIPGIIFTIIN